MELSKLAFLVISLMIALSTAEPPEEVIHGVKWVSLRTFNEK